MFIPEKLSNSVMRLESKMVLNLASDESARILNDLAESKLRISKPKCLSSARNIFLIIYPIICAYRGKLIETELYLGAVLDFANTPEEICRRH